MKGELNVRDQVCSVFSLKMHRINEIDNKLLSNQINDQYSESSIIRPITLSLSINECHVHSIILE